MVMRRGVEPCLHSDGEKAAKRLLCTAYPRRAFCPWERKRK